MTTISRPHISDYSVKVHGDSFAPKIAKVTTLYASEGFKAGIRKYYDAYRVLEGRYRAQRKKIWAEGAAAGLGIGGAPGYMAWQINKISGPWFAAITLFSGGIGLAVSMKKDFESVKSQGELDRARAKNEQNILAELFTRVVGALIQTDSFLRLCLCCKCDKLLFPNALVGNTGRYYDREECVLSDSEKPLKLDSLVTYSVYKQLIHAFQAVRSNPCLSSNGVISRPYQLVEGLIKGLKTDKAKLFSMYVKWLQKAKADTYLDYYTRQWARSEKKTLSNLAGKVFYPRALGDACEVWARIPVPNKQSLKRGYISGDR